LWVQGRPAGAPKLQLVVTNPAFNVLRAGLQGGWAEGAASASRLEPATADALSGGVHRLETRGMRALPAALCCAAQAMQPTFWNAWRWWW
jgi:hypothetical protein